MSTYALTCPTCREVNDAEILLEVATYACRDDPEFLSTRMHCCRCGRDLLLQEWAATEEGSAWITESRSSNPVLREEVELVAQRLATLVAGLRRVCAMGHTDCAEPIEDLLLAHGFALSGIGGESVRTEDDGHAD